jgi:hypothetical protein
MHGRDEKHWLEAKAQLFAGIAHERQIQPESQSSRR